MKKILWVGGGVLVLALVIYALGRTPSASPLDASGGTPTLSVSETAIDLGPMSVNEERSREVRFTNTGNAPLELRRIRTSCGCTEAELTIQGQKFTFNMEMHNASAIRQWKGVLAPGESATMKTIYRPFVMPVQGRVERKIFFETNDPARRSGEITLRALVQ